MNNIFATQKRELLIKNSNRIVDKIGEISKLTTLYNYKTIRIVLEFEDDNEEMKTFEADIDLETLLRIASENISIKFSDAIKKEAFNKVYGILEEFDLHVELMDFVIKYDDCYINNGIIEMTFVQGW